MLFALLIKPSALGLLLAVAAVTTLLLLRGSRKSSSAGKSAKPAAPSAATPNAVVPREVERWQVQMHEFARDVEARLNAKTAALQQLIVEADARIAKLESLGLDEPRRAPSTESTGLAALPGPHFGTSSSARYATVYAMADAGNSAVAIAQRLGTPIGEIELILSLRRPTNEA